jgi:Protein of unknown function (DUF5672)
MNQNISFRVKPKQQQPKRKVNKRKRIIFPTVQKSMYTAIIVEPRKHKALGFVLQNILENLSSDWNVMLFHGTKNTTFVLDLLNQPSLRHHLHRVQLNGFLQVENLNLTDYNRLFMTNRAFYDQIPTETFLVFQTDSIIFRPHKDLIHRFLSYDYVGAPWPWDEVGVCGNGGFSLRKKSKMLEIMEKEPYRDVPEDVFFACPTVVPIHKPSGQEGKHFSIEAMFSETSFGCHKPWFWLACPEMERLRNMYPELRTLESLQGT